MDREIELEFEVEGLKLEIEQYKLIEETLRSQIKELEGTVGKYIKLNKKLLSTNDELVDTIKTLTNYQDNAEKPAPVFKVINGGKQGAQSAEDERSDSGNLDKSG